MSKNKSNVSRMKAQEIKSRIPKFSLSLTETALSNRSDGAHIPRRNFSLSPVVKERNGAVLSGQVPYIASVPYICVYCGNENEMHQERILKTIESMLKYNRLHNCVPTGAIIHPGSNETKKAVLSMAGDLTYHISVNSIESKLFLRKSIIASMLADSKLELDEKRANDLVDSVFEQYAAKKYSTTTLFDPFLFSTEDKPNTVCDHKYLKKDAISRLLLSSVAFETKEQIKYSSTVTDAVAATIETFYSYIEPLLDRQKHFLATSGGNVWNEVPSVFFMARLLNCAYKSVKMGWFIFNDKKSFFEEIDRFAQVYRDTHFGKNAHYLDDLFYAMKKLHSSLDGAFELNAYIEVLEYIVGFLKTLGSFFSREAAGGKRWIVSRDIAYSIAAKGRIALFDAVSPLNTINDVSAVIPRDHFSSNLQNNNDFAKYTHLFNRFVFLDEIDGIFLPGNPLDTSMHDITIMSFLHNALCEQIAFIREKNAAVSAPFIFVNSFFKAHHSLEYRVLPPMIACSTQPIYSVGWCLKLKHNCPDCENRECERSEIYHNAWIKQLTTCDNTACNFVFSLYAPDENHKHDMLKAVGAKTGFVFIDTDTDDIAVDPVYFS